MQTYREMLAELVKRAGSERRAAAMFGIAQTSFNNWMRGRSLPDDEQAKKIADVLGLSREFVVARVHRERAKSVEMRETWDKIAAAFGRAAMLALVAAAPFAVAPEARASGTSHIAGAEHKLHHQRRRARWLSTLGL